jgi:hypothetical protein
MKAMNTTSKKMFSYLMIKKNVKFTTVVKNGARVVATKTHKVQRK